MSISERERSRRALAVSEARHSLAMEGLTVDEETRADQDAYVRGELSAEELTGRGHAHVRDLVAKSTTDDG